MIFAVGRLLTRGKCHKSIGREPCMSKRKGHNGRFCEWTLNSYLLVDTGGLNVREEYIKRWM